jgi:putative DNA primase/helicase
MGWTKESIDDVKGAADVVAVVGADCKLLKDGRDFVACCTLPKHQDDTPSLRVSPKKQLWKCHGCGRGGSVVDWLMDRHGVSFRDAMVQLSTLTGVPLVEDEKRDVPATPQRRKVASWTYEDAEGEPLYVIERWEPGKHGRSKEFIQRLSDGSYGKSPRQVMFRLPRVINAIEDGRTVFVVEGEKAADALASIGAVATTSPGGIQAKVGEFKTWASQGFADPLRGADVVLVPDNDDVGRRFMSEVADVLRPIAASVATVILPVKDKGDDAHEWVEAGGTIADLEAMVVQARTIPEPAPQPVEPMAPSGLLTDTANAEVWAALHRERFRWDQTAGDWLEWDGQRWRRDRSGVALLSTKDVARHWLNAMAACADKDERRAMLKHAEAAESVSRRKAVLDLAKAEPGIAVRAEDFDADPWEINCLNGILDLRTGELAPHNPARLMTKLAPVCYRPQAQAPRFDRFLAEVMPDEDVRRFLMRVFGYAMTGVVREHVMPVLWGAAGRNGKGTLVESVFGCLGDYAMPVPTDLVVERRQQQHPNLVAQLLGARLCVAAEIKATDRIDEAQVKNLTGGDSLRARFLGKEFFTFAATHKLLLQTNHKPRAPADPALFARMRVIPFVVSFHGREDPTLRGTLATEREGILAALVRSCMDWQREGLGTAQAIEEATAEYKEESDPVGQFLAENVIHSPGAKVSGSQLYSEYRKWCEERGEAPWTATAFGRDMPGRGFRKVKQSGGTFYVGIGMRFPGAVVGYGGSAGPSSKIGPRVDRPANPPQPTIPTTTHHTDHNQEDDENDQPMFWNDEQEWRNRSD